jgi:hypothetical protein
VDVGTVVATGAGVAVGAGAHAINPTSRAISIAKAKYFRIFSFLQNLFVFCHSPFVFRHQQKSPCLFDKGIKVLMSSSSCPLSREGCSGCKSEMIFALLDRGRYPGLLVL